MGEGKKTSAQLKMIWQRGAIRPLNQRSKVSNVKMVSEFYSKL